MSAVPSHFRFTALALLAASLALGPWACGETGSTGPFTPGDEDAGADAGPDGGGLDVRMDDRDVALQDVGSGDVGSADVVADLPEPDGASLRLVHAAAGVPAVRVVLDGRALAEPLSFGEASHPFEMVSGTHELLITAVAGAGPPEVLWDTEVTVPKDTDLTAVIATDDLGESALRVLFVSEVESPPPTGQAAVRFVDAVADAPMLAVDLWDDGMNDARMSHLEAAPAGAIRVPAGEPLPARLWSDDARLTRFTLDPLEAGVVTTVVVAGRLNAGAGAEDGPVMVVVTAGGGDALVRPDPQLVLLHASPDVAGLDVFEGARELVDDLGFGELSARLQVAPGGREVALYPAEWGLSSTYPPGPGDGPLVACPEEPLERGERYLVLIAGVLGEDEGGAPLQLIAVRDGFAADAGALGRLVHAAPSAPALSPAALGPAAWAAPELEAIEFGESTPAGGLPLPEGPIVVTLSGASDDWAGPSFALEIAEGARVFLVAADVASSARRAVGPDQLVLFAVDARAGDWELAPLERLPLD